MDVYYRNSYVLYSMHSIPCIALDWLYSVHIIVLIVIYALTLIVLYAIYAMHFLIWIFSYGFSYVHCSQCIVLYALYFMHCKWCNVFYALYQLHWLFELFIYALYYVHWTHSRHLTKRDNKKQKNIQLSSYRNILLDWNWFYMNIHLRKCITCVSYYLKHISTLPANIIVINSTVRKFGGSNNLKQINQGKLVMKWLSLRKNNQILQMSLDSIKRDPFVISFLPWNTHKSPGTHLTSPWYALENP
jgi:hypothetical protein